MNIHSFSPETLWWTQTILQGKTLQEIYFQAALARKPNEPTRLHHMQPPALKHTASSQHWVIRRTYAGIKPSESKHTLLECVDIYYGKTPFSCLLVLFSTFLLPSIVPWRQEGVVEEVVVFFSKLKESELLFYKWRCTYLLCDSGKEEVDEDKSGNKPCQQLIHCDRRKLSQAFNRGNQRQDLEKMGSLGTSAILRPLDQVAGKVRPSGGWSSDPLVLS